MFTSNNFGSGCKVYDLGVGSSFDIKAKFPNDYSKFTINNFFPIVISANASSSARDEVNSNAHSYGQTHIVTGSTSTNVTKSYNNGVLTIGGLSNSSTSNWTHSDINPTDGKSVQIVDTTNTVMVSVRVYLVIGDIKTV